MAKRDDELTPEAIQAAALKLFHARLERQRADRKREARQQARPRTWVPEEEDQPRRDWSIAIDSHGRVRHW